MRSPTQRSLAYLRKRGYLAKVIEKYLKLPGAEWGQRFDVWACDILGVHAQSEQPPVLVQTTSSSNHSSRVNKMLEVAELRMWTASGCIVECHSWGTRKKDGKEYWLGRIERMALDAFGQPVFQAIDEVWSIKRAPKKRQADLAGSVV